MGIFWVLFLCISMSPDAQDIFLLVMKAEKKQKKKHNNICIGFF